MDLASPAKVVRRRPRVEAARRFVASRKIVQTFSVSVLIGMPLLGIFRVDAEGQHVILFWQQVPMAVLVVVLPLLTVVPLGTFFLLARKYGRLFCSWACPQGALNEAAIKSHLALWGRSKPWVTKRERRYPKTAKRKAQRWQTASRGRSWAKARYVLRGVLLPPLAAFAAVSYVVAPQKLAGLLAGGMWTDATVLAFVALAGMLYADLLILQETTCRVCFFGYLQSVASYSERTGVRRNPELKGMCHGCSGCRDACFAGVDPRTRVWEWARSTDLVFDNCVSCGDCLVACDDLTSRRGVPLIMELPPKVVTRTGAGVAGSGDTT